MGWSAASSGTPLWRTGPSVLRDETGDDPFGVAVPNRSRGGYHRRSGGKGPRHGRRPDRRDQRVAR
jgi:hypothetical protein